jgi:hypothetical protein
VEKVRRQARPLRQQLPDGPQIGHLSKSSHYRFKLFHPGQVNAVPERP